MGGYKGTGLEPDSVYTRAMKPHVRITYFGGAEVRARQGCERPWPVWPNEWWLRCRESSLGKDLL